MRASRSMFWRRSACPATKWRCALRSASPALQTSAPPPSASTSASTTGRGARGGQAHLARLAHAPAQGIELDLRILLQYPRDVDEGRLGIAAALGDAAKFDHRGLEVLRARVSDGEARRDALVLLRRAARELALLGRRGPHVDDVQPAVAADERAQAQGRGARADDGSLQL